MATFLITFIPHYEPEVQTFSAGDFRSRPKRLLAAALKQWMFANHNAPDEIIAIGVTESCWSLLNEFEFVPGVESVESSPDGGSAKPNESVESSPDGGSAKPNESVESSPDGGSAISRLPNSAQPNQSVESSPDGGSAKPNLTESDLESLARRVGQRSGVQIHPHVHGPDDDDASMFERAFARLQPLDEVVIDTTHGPVGLWMAFALLEKESHLHEVVFQGFYGGRLGSTDSRFSNATAPDATRGRLALLNLVKRLETQGARNYARNFQEFDQFDRKLSRFEEAVQLASPADFVATLSALETCFSKFSESDDPREASFGRRGQAMFESWKKTHWDVHVLETAWKKNDPLLFSRWAVTCLAGLSILNHPSRHRDYETWRKARDLLQNENTTLAQWLYANGAPIVADDIVRANMIIKRFATQVYPDFDENDVHWMTTFLIRFKTAFPRVNDATRPDKNFGPGVVRLSQDFARGVFLKEASVIKMMIDVCGQLHLLHDRGLCFGTVAPETILRRGQPKLDPRRFSFQWVASRQRPMKLSRICPYMSPEEVRGFGLTPASDIASLGLVALTCLRKSPVFGHEEEFELLEQIRRWEIPDWDSVPMSPALRTILAKCLCKDPSERFATAGALRESLRVEFNRHQRGGVHSM